MRFFTVTLFLLFSLALFAQIDYEKRANGYFEVSSYERALKDYSRALKKDPENVSIIENMIQCYFGSNCDRSEALPLIEKLVKADPNNKRIDLYYAKASFHGNKFDEAFSYITKYQNNVKLDDEEKSEVNSLVNYILTAQALVKKTVNVSFINLGDNINTERSEINPFVCDDEMVLFFGSDKRYLSAYGINYYNVCISLRQDTAWGERKYVSGKINSIYDEIPAGLSPDGKELFVYHNKYGDQTLSSVKYKNGYSFDYLLDVGMPINTNADEYGACLTSGGDTLYFSVEMEDGHTDIMYSIKLPDGFWGIPRSIPGLINTSADENFPYILCDGNKMIFSGNGKNSMGGYDLFYSLKDVNTGNWGEPVNMGYPINDTYDNFTISIPKNKRYGYVSAIRNDSRGLRDIYKLIFNDEEEPYVVYKYQIINWDEYKLSKPQIILWNEHHTLEVGQYICSPETGSFIVAVAPGNYILEICNDDKMMYNEKIFVDEKNMLKKFVLKDITLGL
ncbi:MAG: PD40 domain-containing protein [Marinilabiliaceae bacterium]|nr:PD40 domain-containing protein [Marinilabiliaceae bacterium]